jgi:imidazolonepropionase-like amidohydrolase
MDDMDIALLPFEVIQAFHVSAQFLGMKDHGAIIPGNVANFIVLEGNPALDFTAIRSVDAVYLRGAPLDNPALRRPKGQRP